MGSGKPRGIQAGRKLANKMRVKQEVCTKLHIRYHYLIVMSRLWMARSISGIQRGEESVLVEDEQQKEWPHRDSDIVSRWRKVLL